MTSPLQYLGNRYEEAYITLQALIQGRKFKTFFDPFCGSTSFSMAAIQLNLANYYQVSDCYEPLVALLKVIQSNPEKVATNYEEHYLTTSRLKTYEHQRRYYDEVQNKFNRSLTESQNLLFLSNFAQYNLPLIDKGRYCSQYSSVAQGHSLLNTKQNIFEAAKLLKPSTRISKSDFEDALEYTQAEDLVILDPPYPDLPESMPIYNQLYSKDILHEKLIQQIITLNLKGTAFILFYSVLGVSSEYLLDTKQLNLQHYLRLGMAKNGLFNEYLEHCYISSNLTLDNEKINRIGFVEYEQVKNQTSTEIIAQIKLSKAQSDINSQPGPAIILNNPCDSVTKLDCDIIIDGRAITFTPRENDVASLLLKGNCTKTMANTLGLSTRTVETYLENLKQKMNCRTKLQLISKLNKFYN